MKKYLILTVIALSCLLSCGIRTGKSDGVGYHQIEGQPVEVLHPGDVAMCPPGVKHWHGAAPGSRFAHLAANTNPDKPGVEWFDLLPEEKYNKLPKE